ncbi:OLC1v1028251C1 [Oldenlandia corymbosa var. corymbosa]|uniref:OLC1v1028251C1 n=1 Tax=Oldenlandia corymbosa var. corymbosa TaxID=529605 RepID=A0AAV1CE20_OLDCO|nr:OLC1v1028251C1 [Oldenlandia corymbosa var. corymbosa]
MASKSITASTSAAKDADAEALACLLTPKPPSGDPHIPEDSFHLAYIVYFILGAGFILPWNAFVTAVDYFSYLYPDVPVDRVFAVVYMIISLIGLVVVLSLAHKSSSLLRINVGLGLFVVALLVVPIIDVCYVKGRVGVYGGYYVTVCLVGLCGVANALVQGSLVGAAGELPERYMQAVVAGTGASGVLVAVLRLLTKAVYPQDTRGLRSSADLYFAVAIIMMVLSIMSYNAGHKLRVIKYYTKLKHQALNYEKEARGGDLTRKLWSSTIWKTLGAIKWYASGSSMICIVTICIYPGYITEDVHSAIFKDWYGIVLITGFNILDLIGKCLTSVILIENSKFAIGGSFSRVLFLPLFYGCMHGPKFFRTEIPVSILTCLLGFTNGYFSSVLLILGPKTVPLQHAETAGIALVFFLMIGQSIGSVVSWFWVI